MLSAVGGAADVGWKECGDVMRGCCGGNPSSALTASAPQLLQSAAVDSFKFSLQEIAVSEYAFESRMCKYFTTVL